MRPFLAAICPIAAKGSHEAKATLPPSSDRHYSSVTDAKGMVWSLHDVVSTEFRLR